MLRVLSELLWVIRRHGVEISTSTAIDAARACLEVGWDDRALLRAAIAATIVKRRDDLARVHRAFDDFFAAGGHPNDLFGRLAASGFDETELDALRRLLIALGQQRGGGEVQVLASMSGHAGEIEWLLRGAGLRRLTRSMTSSSSIGYYTEQAARELGVSRAGSAMPRIELALSDAVGAERAAALARALRGELEALRARIRLTLEARVSEAEGAPVGSGMDAPFAAMSDAEAAEVKRALRTLAARLRGAARVRERRAGRGRFDPRRTVRRAMRTGGVPIEVARRLRRRDRPSLVVVCDVSDSVRAASGFFLELVASASDLFHRVRSFVFIAEVAETTELFKGTTRDKAMAAIASGAVVSIGGVSNYARSLAELERRIARRLDRRTTVVVLGDGRTNFRGSGADVVRRLRDRARGVLWLCPEPRSSWGMGDSAMPELAAAVTEAISVRSGRELEAAARRLVRFR
ncbi:MAG: VWA domain-containing protein [Myxococcales bacterium]|nr:VWA domain-containing protein [Myxococcales bacterium]